MSAASDAPRGTKEDIFLKNKIARDEMRNWMIKHPVGTLICLEQAWLLDKDELSGLCLIIKYDEPAALVAMWSSTLEKMIHFPIFREIERNDLTKL